MGHPVSIESIRFETDGLAYVDAGEDFREGTRLYDSAVVGRVHLHVNGEEVVFGNRLPADVDVSDTVRAMYETIVELRTTGSADAYPFCCVCGDRGCAYVRWELERADDRVRLVTEDLLGEPIGAHRYELRLETLRDAVAELSGRVEAALEGAGARRATAGTVQEFVDRRRRLARWSEE